MIRRTMVFMVLCLMLCVSACVDEAKIKELLGKLPADGSAEGQKVAAELVALGPDGIKEICGMLAPWGAGDDTKAQYALSGLAMYVSRPSAKGGSASGGGAEKERKMFAGVLVTALQAATDNEVKAFLIRLLQLAGKDEAVAPLSAFLTDEMLCDPATQALLAIHTPKAVAALVKALPGAQGAKRVTIIRALGELRRKEAVEQLIKDATSNDVTIRRAALYALANIGDPSAADVLAKAAQATSPFERATATSFYLLFARRLAEAGNKEQCASICRELLKTRTAPPDENVRCAALSTLVAALGKDATGDLLAAMDNGNKEIREAAVALACALPGEDVTAKCVEKMKQASPEARGEILTMLGRRGDKSALPALLEAVKDKDQGVRLAAIAASARLGGGDALTALMAVFKTDQTDDIKAAQEALVRLPGEEVLKAAAGALPSVPPASRVALLNILAVRRAKAHAEVIFAATKDEDRNVRREAIKALGEVASEKDIPRVIDLLLSSSDNTDRSVAQRAIAIASGRIADPERRAEPLLAALEKATGEQRGLLLRTMAQVGGKKALQVVLTDVKSPDAGIQDAAIRALADWQDVAAASELMKIARSSEKETHQVLALRGYVRIVGACDLSPDKKVAMFTDAMAAAKRPEEKRLVLAGLSDVKSVEALRLAASYVEDPALQTEAVAAVVKIACPKDRKDKGLAGPEVAAALKKVLPLIKDAARRKQAEEHLRAISKETKGAPSPPKVSAPAPDPMNLAFGKPVKASVNWQGDHRPELAVDGNYADLHSAWFGAKWPCSFEVDLQKPVKIDTVHVFFYWDGSRYYQYTVDVSDDGKEWKTVADASKNTTPSGPRGVLHNFPAVEARYVRVNILKNSANEAVHLVELKVYAEGTAPRPPPPPKPDAEGFIPLFNGKDLTGWTGAVKGYDPLDGVLVCDEKRGGVLFAEKEYSDFIFRFEFKLTPGANNGVGIRVPAGGHASYDGMEIQILDHADNRYSGWLKPYQFHGSIYGVVPAKPEGMKPIGEWNFEEIKAEGPHITVTLNGTVIVDADISKVAEPMDHKPHPGLKRDKGYIGFLGHGSHVEFRNIRIKELR